MTVRVPVLLVVEDEPGVLSLVRRLAETAGFEVIGCPSGQAACQQARARQTDAAFVDLKLPDTDGLELLRTLDGVVSGRRTVIMTGHATLATAVEAGKLGVRDYLRKPLDIRRVTELLRTLREEAAGSSELADSPEGRFGLTGSSRVIRDLFLRIERLAPYVQRALITGESGTGKELVARALHRLGPRQDQPFIVLDCPTLDARAGRPGAAWGARDGEPTLPPSLLAMADHGVLFLDEVGEMPLSVQAQLVQALSAGTPAVNRGAGPVDVFVFASTSRSLPDEIGAGRFRRDLYYSLSIAELSVPPLRARRGDIPALARRFAEECASRLGKPSRGLAPEGERFLEAQAWTSGNVRELRHVIERAVLLTDDEWLDAAVLGLAAPERHDASPAVVRPPDRGRPAPATHAAPTAYLSDVERAHIVRALDETGGNKKAAARLLGLSRRALYRRLERLDLSATIARRPSPGEGSSAASGEDHGNRNSADERL